MNKKIVDWVSSPTSFTVKLLPLLFYIFIFLLPNLSVDATDYRPWFGRVLELDLSVDCLIQTFTRVNTTAGCNRVSEFDTFINLDASMAVWETIAAEIEVIAAETKKQSFGMDAIRLTGRYRFLNDIVGDPLSLSTGITLSAIFPPVRKSIATFDHGGIAAEATLSVGKEVSIMQYWLSRAWSVLGVGVADVGSPWIRWNIAWEHNWCERHLLEIFSDSIWGFGQDRLNLQYFNGYGPVRYQAIDLGARYYYQFDIGVQASVGYGYRVFSRNCPENANLIFLKLFYPF